MRYPPGVQTHRLAFDERPTCRSCLRPKAHCLCDAVPPFRAHCDVLVVQHPHERRKYHGTAKLTCRYILNSVLLRGVDFTEEELRVFAGERSLYLLFPGDDASDCESVPLTTNHGIVVVDGTWSEAGKVLKRNPFLQRLPKVSFRRPLESQYHIRKQPKPHCLSTIESVAHFLMLNARVSLAEEKLPSYKSLLQAFAKMVQQQLEFFPRMRASSESPG